MSLSELEWEEYEPLNSLTTHEASEILRLEGIFLIDRSVLNDDYALHFDDLFFLECFRNANAFFRSFKAAVMSAEAWQAILNLRIKLCRDGMFEAYLDEEWCDLIGIDALTFDEAIGQEFSGASDQSIQHVALELLQSAWCRISFDAQLFLRSKQPRSSASTDSDADADFEADAAIEYLAPRFN